MWPIPNRQFEADLLKLRESPSPELMEFILTEYMKPICENQWYGQFDWVEGEEAVQEAFLDCWERIKPALEPDKLKRVVAFYRGSMEAINDALGQRGYRRIDRYGKPLSTWEHGVCQAFAYFTQVAKCRICDYAKAEGRRMGRDVSIVDHIRQQPAFRRAKARRTIRHEDDSRTSDTHGAMATCRVA